MRAYVGLMALFTPLAASWGASTCVAQTAPSGDAEITVIKKGVFNLKEGESKDLTDRGIILHLRKVVGEPGETPERAVYPINGMGDGSNAVGTRTDLKKFRATAEFVKDLRVCVLDFVSASKPVGAPATAKFRLMCE